MSRYRSTHSLDVESPSHTLSRKLPTNQIEVGRWLMACQFDVLLNAGVPPHGPEVAVEALNLAEYLESLLSIYKPDSEFSQINRAPSDMPVGVSASTAELISIALELQEQTDQAFNITAASLSDVWGFSRRAGAMPEEADIANAVDAANARAIMVDPSSRSVTRKREDVHINSGGIGKGYAIDQMAAMLTGRSVDDFLVHGGHSSILARGNRYNIDSQDGWRIALRHPDQQKVLLGEVRLRNMALGTSGPANQFFYFNGVRYGHIIDPRTGWPASGMLSITVLHPSAMKADALSTALFVLGVERAEAYCEKYPETGFLAILPTKRQGHVEIVSCNIAGDIWSPASI